MSPPPTLMEVVRLSTGYLNGHGSESPRLDAELLAAKALSIRRLDVFLQFDRPLDEAQLTVVRELVRRRGGGEPIAYITGEREFYGRPFTVSPAVLVPRPETERLVELALARLAGGAGDGALVADLGTGSGCIAVTLAAELPGLRVVATDVSAEALAVARANAQRHGVDDRVELRLGSWATPLAGEDLSGAVSNPPYVRSGELGQLSRDVRCHEPALALDGGADGLTAYRELLLGLSPLLGEGAWLALEVDPRDAAAVAALAGAALGDASPGIGDDLAGRPRVVSVARGGGAA